MPAKVAIIGSGLAGLTAAYILTNDPDQRFEVTIYEKHALFGMDFSSFSIPTEDIDAEGKRTKGEARIDVPLRVVFRRYYSSLFKLFEHLNLTFAPADMTLSFSKLPPPTPGTPSPLPTTYFSESCLDVDFLGFRFPIPNPRAHLTVFQASQIAADWYRFRAYARLIYHADHLGTLKGQTLSEFLRTGGYSDVFIHGAFMPAVASTSTCSYETTMRMPADIIVDFMAKRLLNDRVVKVREGVKAVCERLTEKVEVMRFGCGVKSVQCVQGIERKKVAVEDDTGRSETFDYVIFATQADQARRMLSASPTFPLASATAVPAALLRTLGSFVYESTSAVTHTDPTFMPRDRRDWSAINVCVPAQGTTQADVPEGCYPDQPMTTCWMNALMPSLKGQPDVFQTVNPLLPIPTGEAQLQSLALLGRVVLTNATYSMLDALDDLQSTNNLYFVGSYTYPGIPLLEGCVQSAVRVARLILSGGDLASEKAEQEARRVIPWANEEEGTWEKGRMMEWYFDERARKRKASGEEEGSVGVVVARGLLRMLEYRVVAGGVLVLWNMFMLMVVALFLGAIAIGMGVRDVVKWIRAKVDSRIVE